MLQPPLPGMEGPPAPFDGAPTAGRRPPTVDRRPLAVRMEAAIDSAIEGFVDSGLWSWFAILAASHAVLICALAAVPLLPPYISIQIVSTGQCAGTVALVERCAALVLLASFLSFGVQLDGLIGSRGIAPAASTMRKRKANAGWQQATWPERRAAMHRAPTIFWLVEPSDAMLRAVCGAGALVALRLALGGGAWAGASADGVATWCGHLWLVGYVCQISLISVSGDFLGLQSDSNLCETCALFAVLALLRLGGEDTRTACAAIAALRWLAARKMLGCGLCKYYGSPMWKAKTAMGVHYHTQPLPNPLSRWAHHLPPAVHRASCLLTLVVEICLPLLGLAPIPFFQRLACAAFVGLNLAINLTGNFGFIGALAVAESLALLDDSVLPQSMRRAAGADAWRAAWFGGVGEFAACAVRLVGCCLLMCYIAASLAPLVQAARYSVDSPLLPVCEAIYEALRKPRLCNYYAKFASMHSFRWEVVLEGSHDGEAWQQYGWRYKPWHASRSPPWLPLHLPRLDWRIWFLPLGVRRQGADYKPPAWLRGLLLAISRHEPAVLRLLSTSANPFPHAPPRYLRTRLVAFDFAPPHAYDHWRCTPLPTSGPKYDTSALCLELTRNPTRREGEGAGAAGSGAGGSGGASAGGGECTRRRSTSPSPIVD